VAATGAIGNAPAGSKSKTVDLFQQFSMLIAGIASQSGASTLITS
jgi:hypothetical protein